MRVKSGRAEGLPYSFSRWTDVPAAKWPWFLNAILAKRSMMAFDPRNAIPYEWSLAPEDTLGMVFWTKCPDKLAKAPFVLDQYKLKVHVTMTGWHEVEIGAPSIEEATEATKRIAGRWGKENVVWRFSPVPLVEDTLARFEQIAKGVEGSVDRVYLSFLQENDRISETRDRETKLQLMLDMAGVAASRGIRVLLCNEDRTLAKVNELPENLSAGVCAPPEDFGQVGLAPPPSEGCGCVLMVDPFTINETCTLGCTYCYAADKNLAPKKRNTTRSLPVVR